MHLPITTRLLPTIATFILSVMVCVSAWAQEIGIMQTSLYKARQGQETGLYLSVSSDFDLPNGVEEALLRGVPLYFVMDFSLQRNRWYWFDKDVSNASLISRLSYSPLTRQFRLSRGGLSQSFDSLNAALSVLNFVVDWKVSPQQYLDASKEYEAEVRLRLDIKQLPLPLQVSIGASDWNLSSDWQAVTFDADIHQPN